MKGIFFPRTLGLFAITFFFQYAQADITTIQGADHLNNHMKENSVVIAKFHSPMCSACKNFAPTFQAAANLPGVSFVSVDITDAKNKPLLQRFPVSGVPTVHFIKDGKSVGSLTGSQYKAADIHVSAKRLLGL